MKEISIKKHQVAGFIVMWAMSVCSFLAVDLLNGKGVDGARVATAMIVQAVLFAGFVGAGVFLKRWRMVRSSRAH